jgi:hypothetical protein
MKKMKKSIYILIVIFLAYGKSFASYADFLNIIGVDSTEKLFGPGIHTSNLNEGKLIVNKIYFENYFCKTPSRRCLDFSYLMNSESEEHTDCAKLFDLYKEMKSFRITKSDYSPLDLVNTTNSLKSVESSSEYAPSLNLKINNLQNVNLEEYFSLLIDPTYYRGFGIRIGI